MPLLLLPYLSTKHFWHLGTSDVISWAVLSLLSPPRTEMSKRSSRLLAVSDPIDRLELTH